MNYNYLNWLKESRNSNLVRQNNGDTGLPMPAPNKDFKFAILTWESRRLF